MLHDTLANVHSVFYVFFQYIFGWSNVSLNNKVSIDNKYVCKSEYIYITENCSFKTEAICIFFRVEEDDSMRYIQRCLCNTECLLKLSLCVC